MYSTTAVQVCFLRNSKMIKNQFCDSLGEDPSKFWVDISDQILIFGTHDPADRLLLEIDSVEKTVFLSGGFYYKLKFKQQLAYITFLIF